MLTTPRRSVQYPNTDRSDRADIALHLSYLALALDADVLFVQGTDAARGAAAHQTSGGLFWYATDTQVMWYDDGTTWHTVGSIPNNTITNVMVNSAAAIAYSKLNLAASIVNADIAAAAAIAISKLAGYPSDVSKQLNGDGSWSAPVIVANLQGGSYTLVATDTNKNIEMNVGTANNLTVPPNSSVAFPVGTTVTIGQLGAGQTTIVAGAGVTLRAYNGNLKLAGQYAIASIIKRATDEWWVGGNLVP